MHSAHVTKSSNAGFDPRELDRRKFQAAAAQAIDRQAAAIQQTREYMADVSVRLDNQDIAFRGVATQAACAYVVIMQRGFLGRLRWLLTGR